MNSRNNSQDSNDIRRQLIIDAAARGIKCGEKVRRGGCVGIVKDVIAWLPGDKSGGVRVSSLVLEEERKKQPFAFACYGPTHYEAIYSVPVNQLTVASPVSC